MKRDKEVVLDDKKGPDEHKNRYGKRPVWQWVVIYIIAGIVVYGLIYFIFFNGNY